LWNYARMHFYCWEYARMYSSYLSAGLTRKLKQLMRDYCKDWWILLKRINFMRRNMMNIVVWASGAVVMGLSHYLVSPLRYEYESNYLNYLRQHLHSHSCLCFTCSASCCLPMSWFWEDAFRCFYSVKVTCYWTRRSTWGLASHWSQVLAWMLIT